MQLGDKFWTTRWKPDDRQPDLLMQPYLAEAEIIGFDKISGAVLVRSQGDEFFMGWKSVRKDLRHTLAQSDET